MVETWVIIVIKWYCFIPLVSKSVMVNLLLFVPAPCKKYKLCALPAFLFRPSLDCNRTFIFRVQKSSSTPYNPSLVIVNDAILYILSP